MGYLNIPYDRVTIELTNSIIWFEDDGILYSRYKSSPFVQASREQMAADMQKFKDYVGAKRVLIIAESHPQAESPAKEDRDYISEQLSAITKAMAILTPSAISRMVVNLFFLFKPAPFPTKRFQNVSEAKKWLQSSTGRHLHVL